MSDHVPEAQEGRVVPVQRRTCHGRRGVVRPGSDDPDRRACRLAGQIGQKRPEVGARGHDLGQESARCPHSLDEIGIPLASDGVEALARTCDRVLGHAPPGQEVVEQVGHHEQPLRLLEQRIVGFAHREQLAQRVDGHELDARAPIDLGPRHPAEGARKDALRPSVAVVDGVREQPSAAVEQAEVDTPRVHPDRRDRAVRLGPPDRGDYVLEKAQEVPVEGPAQADRDIRETVALAELQALAVQRSDDPAAAFGAEVEGEQTKRLAHLRARRGGGAGAVCR